MPVITIKEKEYTYNEDEVISFGEGLIGLPEMRRAILISMDQFEPFCWLASVDTDKHRFIVVDPAKIYDGYEALESDSDEKTNVWAIVKISSDWRKTTVNLRAPLLISSADKKGEQVVLNESSYGLAETLPQV